MMKKAKREGFPGIRLLLLCAVMVIGLGLLLMVPAMAAIEPFSDPEAPLPQFSVPGGAYYEPQTVTISIPKDYVLCYTTDGSDPFNHYGSVPASNAQRALHSATITVTENCMIRSVLVRESNPNARRLFINGREASVSYYILKLGEVLSGSVVFSQAGGFYNEPQEVTLSCLPGWTICYTMDGSEPTEIIESRRAPRGLGHGNPVTFTVSDNCRIKAIAYKQPRGFAKGYDFSSVSDVSYQIAGSEIAVDGAITFSPGGGTYEDAQDITLTAPADWLISYTTDGSSPISTFSGLHGLGPVGLGKSNPVSLTVSDSCTIRAVAYQIPNPDLGITDYIFSDISEQTYLISPAGSAQVSEILFSPGGGIYEAPQEITLSAPSGWNICYTTNGSNPFRVRGEGSFPVGLGKSNPVTLTVSDSCTIRAVAYKELNHWQYTFGDIAEQTYTIIPPSPRLYLDSPLFPSVSEGYEQPDAVPIIITSYSNCDATVSSVALSGPDADYFTLNKTDGTVIVAGDTDDSTYTIQPAAGLPAGIYTATVTVTYDGDATDSADFSFTVNEWDAAAAPVFSLPSGTYSAVQQLELYCSTEDTSIYYTTDGTDPDSAVNGILYTGPIPVFADTTVKAIAVKPGLRRSLISEAAYIMDLTLFYGTNDVFLGAEYQPVSFRFTAPEDGVYRFYSNSQDISPSIMIYDGDDQIEYHTGMYQSHHCIAELEGGKEYTVKIESLHGTGNITVQVNPTTLYNICADPSIEHGTVTVSQGALPVSDGSALGKAYAGAEVYFSATPEEGYGLADLSVVNAVGRVLSRESAVTMPWGDVTVRAHFDTIHMLFWPSEEEADEHAHLEVVWINDGGMGAWGDGREVVRGQTVGLRWNFDDGYDADTFTLVTAGGIPVDWTYAWDNDNKKIIQFTMPGEDVYTAMTSSTFSFDSADFVLPSGTNSVEQSAFEGDTHITSAVIPAECTGIGKWAFRNCTNLRYIRVPENCAVGEDAFEGCDLVYIYCRENSPAWQYCQDHDGNTVFVAE